MSGVRACKKQVYLAVIGHMYWWEIFALLSSFSCCWWSLRLYILKFSKVTVREFWVQMHCFFKNNRYLQTLNSFVKESFYWSNPNHRCIQDHQVQPSAVRSGPLLPQNDTTLPSTHQFCYAAFCYLDSNNKLTFITFLLSFSNTHLSHH